MTSWSSHYAASCKTLALAGLFCLIWAVDSSLVSLSLLFTQHILCAYICMYVYHVLGEKKENFCTAWCPGAANQASASATDSPLVAFQLCHCWSCFITSDGAQLLLSGGPSVSAALFGPVWLHFDPQSAPPPPPTALPYAHIKSLPRPSYLPLICLFFNG